MSCSNGDRDDRVVRQASARSKTARAVESKKTAGLGAKMHGAYRRMTSADMYPSRQDVQRETDTRYVPLGFAKYVAPEIDPTDYNVFRLAGWRVVVPRATCGLRTRELLYRIYKFGPQSAGYVRVGDTLVPAMMGVGDRLTLSQSTLGATDDYALSQ
ncbi:MAG: hypothetical protein KGL39_01695 [Patescibacteria group bacterium]|nr:hypothetical protein [Patescibacteria group bacterium]